MAEETKVELPLTEYIRFMQDSFELEHLRTMAYREAFKHVTEDELVGLMEGKRTIANDAYAHYYGVPEQPQQNIASEPQAPNPPAIIIEEDEESKNKEE